eukprot:TRINITY_DN27245_c0_g1_i1.p1 TRINITY_DN27245_c0_g1~~TRINITY_DN27245_c0_g1_i1.p1  ORF type:complete len:441 (-),score=43.68 TRINITY_DN27245_c0_g1_i1:266-1588(-)
MVWSLRKILRAFWILLCITTFILMPILIVKYGGDDWSAKQQIWLVAGIFVILTVPISVYEVAMHVEYYYRPTLQRHVIRILWMVPIYAVDSWFALRFKEARFYLDPIRETYEAYVIYNFYMYLIRFLEDETGDLENYMGQKQQQHHIWGVQYIARDWPMEKHFLRKCKQGVLVYVIVRPIMTMVSFICKWYDAYGEGVFSFDKGYLYVALINSVAQMWALYCLVIFYHATNSELRPIQPLKKFIIIKLVVFFSFWQGITIALLFRIGVIQPSGNWKTYDKQEMSSAIQDFLICIEMFFAAIGHAWAFPVEDYVDPTVPPRGFFANVRDMFDVRDVVTDVSGVVDDAVNRTTHKVVYAGRQATHMATRPFANLITNNKNQKQGGNSRQQDEQLLTDYRGDLLSNEEVDVQQESGNSSGNSSALARPKTRNKSGDLSDREMV